MYKIKNPKETNKSGANGPIETLEVGSYAIDECASFADWSYLTCVFCRNRETEKNPHIIRRLHATSEISLRNYWYYALLIYNLVYYFRTRKLLTSATNVHWLLIPVSII